MAAVDKPDEVADTVLIRAWLAGSEPPIPDLNAQLKKWTSFFDEWEASADVRRQARQLKRNMETMTRAQIEAEIISLVQNMNAVYNDAADIP